MKIIVLTFAALAVAFAQAPAADKMAPAKDAKMAPAKETKKKAKKAKKEAAMKPAAPAAK